MQLPEKYNPLSAAVKSMAPEGEITVSVTRGDVQLLVPRELVHSVLKMLKEEFHYTYLSDMVSTDRFTSEDRFEMIWNIVSLKDRSRIFVKTRIPEDNPTLPTSIDIWPAAEWNEREAFDMMGIRFDGHPDLRRLFLPEDFEYFPLRKEFPLMGVPGSIPLPSTSPDVD
jgi:NADH-quinone oxidoreductase subunit C